MIQFTEEGTAIRRDLHYIKIISLALLLALATCGRKNTRDDNGPVIATGTPELVAASGSLSLSAVKLANLQRLIKEMTGYQAVTLGGKSVSITDRYTPASKANYRAYWLGYFKSLGISATELPYKTAYTMGETQGHNMEAVLPGKSKDSIIIIVHYDSDGPPGHEIDNPAVDDNMTGMAILMEAARILSANKNDLHYTVRFVATDYEEQVHPTLEGTRVYASYIKALSQAEHFQLVAAIDADQTGWNCFATNECQDDSKGMTFDLFSCSDSPKQYQSDAFGNLFEDFVTKNSSMTVERDCTEDDSDSYALWEIGVPSLVFIEHNPIYNDHYDEDGGDTIDTIDFQYFYGIAQVSIGFMARLAGLNPSR